MSEKPPAKRRRKSRAAVRDDIACERHDEPLVRVKAPKTSTRARKAARSKPSTPAPDIGVDQFDAALTAAALIEQSLASEDAARADDAAAAAVPSEPAWPAPSTTDPAWVAAWVRGANGEAPVESYAPERTVECHDASKSAPRAEGGCSDGWIPGGIPVLTDLVDEPCDEPPFDAPSLEDLCGAGETNSAPSVLEDACDAAGVVAPKAWRAHARVHVQHDPAKLEYLRRAREAAQAQALAHTEREVPQISRWTIAAGVAAPLLAIGAWAVLNSVAGDRGAAAVGSAAAAPAAAATARDPLLDYERGLQLLGSSRTRDGLALLQSAAEAGLAPAQYRLAKIYEHGEGAPRDLNAAREWTERAARGGNCRAMHDLGVYYAQGDAVQRNESLAFDWFQQAAELGVVDSQYNLGLLYQHGRGVAASADHALYWFLVAARQHDLNAIDRAVALAAQMTPDQVERAQALAHRFEARSADPIANGATGNAARVSCAADLERPENS